MPKEVTFSEVARGIEEQLNNGHPDGYHGDSGRFEIKSQQVRHHPIHGVDGQMLFEKDITSLVFDCPVMRPVFTSAQEGNDRFSERVEYIQEVLRRYIEQECLTAIQFVVRANHFWQVLGFEVLVISNTGLTETDLDKTHQRYGTVVDNPIFA